MQKVLVWVGWVLKGKEWIGPPIGGSKKEK